MQELTVNDVQFKRLDRSLFPRCKSFFNPHTEIEEFLKKKTQSMKYQDKFEAQTTLCLFDNKIIGYYSLAASSIRIDNVSDIFFPSVEIYRIGVDFKAKEFFQSQEYKAEIGSLMLTNIIQFCLSINDNGLAVKYIKVYADPTEIPYKEKNYNAYLWYQEKGFENVEIAQIEGNPERLKLLALPILFSE